MITKMDLEELVRERLKLPDNVIINKACVLISNECEDLEIVGDTEVVLPATVTTNIEQPRPALTMTKTKMLGKLDGRRKREQGNTIKKRRESDDFTTPSTGRALPGAGSKITDAQVKGLKAVLHARKAIGKLTDNQLSALKTMEGVRTPKMTPEMRQQLKDIHDESTPQRGS